jgi:hypothetical protein
MTTWLDVSYSLPDIEELADENLRVVSLVGLAMARIESEGLVGYFLSTEARHLEAAIDAMSRIGAGRLADVLTAAASLVGRDRAGRDDQRDAILAQFADDAELQRLESVVDDAIDEAVVRLENHIGRCGLERGAVGVQLPAYRLRVQGVGEDADFRGEVMVEAEADLYPVFEELGVRRFEDWNGEVFEVEDDVGLDEYLTMPTRWFDPSDAASEFDKLHEFLRVRPSSVPRQDDLMTEIRYLRKKLGELGGSTQGWHLFLA